MQNIGFVYARHIVKTLPKEKMKIGMVVKVLHNEERFWVLVTNIGEKVFTGTVDNHLIHDHGFNYGSVVKFKYGDIVDYEF